MKNLLIISLLLLLAITVSGCSKSYEKKPFFTGTEKLMVCKRPYYNSMSCYNLSVRNNDGETMIVFFENGGNIELEDIYCTETIHNDGICQGVDKEGNTWDVLPVDASLE